MIYYVIYCFKIESARQGWSVFEYVVNGKSKGNGKGGDISLPIRF